MKMQHCIETAKKNKNTLVAIGIATLIILVFAISTILADDTIAAQLHVEQGTVLVNNNPVTEATKTLKLNDVIETKNTTATIILYESIFVTLQTNTQVTLEDLARQHPKISQQKGTTWNKFTRLLGINQYSAKTKTSVASVRGTAFELSEDKIITGDGEVFYTTEGKNYVVKELEVIEKKNKQVQQRKANDEETARIKQHFERTIKEMQKIALKKIRLQNKINEKQTKARLENIDKEIKRINEQTKRYEQRMREKINEKIMIEKETKRVQREETKQTENRIQKTKTPEKLAVQKPARQLKNINEIGRTITKTIKANKNIEIKKSPERTITKTAIGSISRNAGARGHSGSGGGKSSGSSSSATVSSEGSVSADGRK